ncbi:MAG: DUF1015 domain-containing protein [Spirochaetaceae bacterium]|jgi:uncharacterized protein (DUF1015 family)|nr:DUF1015 domain-containing protein [Spirochaetaceae bacterium]
MFREDVYQRLAVLGIAVPEMLLPKSMVDMHKWAIIACDQFTHDRTFWKKMADFVGNAPSTLNLIFPEVYIGDKEADDRIQAIHQTMNAYIKNEIFETSKQGLIYVERQSATGQRSQGLVAALDLEQYDWRKDTSLPARATEETVPERLPPRMAIRRGAALETSHVLLLIEDEKNRILGGLKQRTLATTPVYKTSLAPEAGTIEGWLLDQESDWTYLAEQLEALAEQAVSRYGAPPFLYAVGDGNHSLASAKAVWEEYKRTRGGATGIMEHPCRYALVEIKNLYDPALRFEPIHRLVLGADMAEITTLLSKLPGFTCRVTGDGEDIVDLVRDRGAAKTRLGLIANTERILIETDAQGLVTHYLQPLLDAFVSEKPIYAVDYIHGREALYETAAGNKEKRGVGILLPPVEKDGLFKTVATGGPLPRKSFSMGEALDKRFYLECRKLFC